MSDRMLKVKNRSASQVIYTIADLGVRREFTPGETKTLPYDELEKLTWQAGGRELILNFLQVSENKAIESLGIDIEPEYHMSEEQIAELIVSGDFNAYLDCLEFAPAGVIDLLKVFAVKIPMTDTRKIEALKEKTGFDVAKAIAMERADKEPEVDEASKTEETPVRRTAAQATPRRRTDVSYEQEEAAVVETLVAPKYKVVSK